MERDREREREREKEKTVQNRPVKLVSLKSFKKLSKWLSKFLIHSLVITFYIYQLRMKIET
jgi:hypothetical protein